MIYNITKLHYILPFHTTVQLVMHNGTESGSHDMAQQLTITETFWLPNYDLLIKQYHPTL